jgi:hypothetical protein
MKDSSTRTASSGLYALYAGAKTSQVGICWYGRTVFPDCQSYQSAVLVRFGSHQFRAIQNQRSADARRSLRHRFGLRRYLCIEQKLFELILIIFAVLAAIRFLFSAMFP